MKKEIFVIGAIILVILTNSISAISITQINNQKNMAEKSLSDEKSKCIGRIYGQTRVFVGPPPVWTTQPIPFAKVNVGLRRCRSNITGHFEFNNLLVPMEYILVGRFFGLMVAFGIARLTLEEPEAEVCIAFDPWYPYPSNISDSNNITRIQIN